MTQIKTDNNMRKTDFYSKYRISEVKPVDVARRTVSASDFAKATSEFLNGNFRGLCSVNSDISESGNIYIVVSEDGAAYFFKIMLSYIKADRYVDIDIKIVEDELRVSISSDGHLPFDKSDGLELIRLARQAGFNVNISDELMTLRTVANCSMTFKVYAVSRQRFASKYHEIFYTGIIK